MSAGVGGLDWSTVDTNPGPTAPPRQMPGWAADRSPVRLPRPLRGHVADPWWIRPALLVLLAATAVGYLWGLGASQYANSFYAAAVQAGTQSWKAWFFGSFDASNFITVDKPPASLWVMGLSGRIFGFNSWSMLVPNALEGVAAVGILYLAVRRWIGPRAGLLAAAVFALTPVAVLMFKFNNPDALLVLLLVVAAYCVVRATEDGGFRWIALAGAAVGFAFLTKMMQAFLPVPAFALVYLVAAPTSVGRRLLGLLAGAGAIVVSAGWYVAAVELWPKDSRPYIGGSTNNSILELTFGYNGLGRVFGGDGNPGGGAGRGMFTGLPQGDLPAGAAAYLNQMAPPGGVGGPGTGGGPGGGMFGGATGWNRLFSGEMGTQISWLLPAALIALVGGLWVTRRAARTDRVRAGLLLWGGWTLVTGGVFSYMSGIIHPYYTIAVAPGIGGLLAFGGTALWRARDSWVSRVLMAAAVGLTGGWSFVLLNRTPDWYPALRFVVVAAAGVGVLALLIGRRLPTRSVVGAVVGAAAVALALGAPSAAYAVETASAPHSGSIPSAGPATAGGGFPSGMTRQFFGPTGGATNGAASGRPRDDRGFGGGAGGSAGGPDGGFGGGVAADSEIVQLLRNGQAGHRWAAATSGSQSAGPLELASGTAVMAMGGFSGGDPTPTLDQFKQYVAAGDIHYYIAGGGAGRSAAPDASAGAAPAAGDDPAASGEPGGSSGPGVFGAPGETGGFGGPGGFGGRGSGEITSWVESRFTALTVGGRTVYDLTRPTS
ncbi:MULTISPECIES: ArnT family glycosyltransferase [Protofrankia]|uniref:Glycosyl transferase family 39 n=1 Tax=Candidatus Protofrankia datiscae TaxID=2716812 RepID=F8B5D5_9ACTN|nr:MULTISPECIES: glycosyltransferase family 39 protein [Protofrankia]AEH07987.1 glycosyl transferase family 39 [Candidatus Protofrankia datiscae]